MSKDKNKAVAVVVAHPDDETLWVGGTILTHPSWQWFILTLCRGSDQDRAPKFFRALQRLGAGGRMGDLDDGPDQEPLRPLQIQETILELLPHTHFDLIISHSPAGEYTRHRRHEEVGSAMIRLWQEKISADELWAFAYEDGGKRYLPRPIRAAHLYLALSEDIWQQKRAIITTTYGFPEDGFEAQTTPRQEAFWQFRNPQDAREWLDKKVFHDESTAII